MKRYSLIVASAGLLLSLAAPAAEELREEKPAQAPLEIDANKSETYQSGKWEYRYEIKDRRSKSEGRWGRLLVEGKELPEPKNIHDHVVAPWGILYWVGVPPTRWGSHGWMTRPGARAPVGQLLPPPDGPAGAKATTLGEDANGKTVAAKIGDVFAIRLRGNATTGYQWQVAKVDGDAVVQVGKMEYLADQAEGRVGAGGTFVIAFRAEKPGKATPALAYVRPWEKGKEPRESFAVTIAVEAAEPAKP